MVSSAPDRRSEWRQFAIARVFQVGVGSAVEKGLCRGPLSHQQLNILVFTQQIPSRSALCSSSHALP